MLTSAVDRDIIKQSSHTEIFMFVKAYLFDCFGRSEVAALLSSHDLFGQPPVERVNVTIRTHGCLRGSMSAEGDSLGSQLQAAARSAACDRRFKSRLSVIELNEAELEIWLQTGSEQITREEITAGHFLELGIDGIEIRWEKKFAYYKPSVAITSGKDTIEALLSSLCHKAGIAKDAWKAQESTLLRTKWLSLSYCSTGIVSPHLPHRGDITRANIIRWLRESVAYLTNSLQASGDFTYIYDPIKNLEVVEPSNSVRLAGSLYSLSCFYDSPYVNADDTAFEKAIRTVATTQIRRTIESEDGGRIMPEPNPTAPPKMGSTALLTLALGGRRLSEQFGSAYESLYQSVLLAQMPSGRFQTQLGSNDENMRSSEFFSGQALLALVQRAEGGDADAMKRCDVAFAAYQQQFQDSPSTAFVGWHVDVWSRMAILTQRKDYADFAFEQADWLLTIQIESARETRWIGGFRMGDQMPKFSSIVFLEAVVRAYVLARSIEDSERTERYRHAIQSGIRFCERLRLCEEQMAWYPNPQRSKGGIALSLLDKRVRCDVPQHFITLCLAVLNAEDLISDTETTVDDKTISLTTELPDFSEEIAACTLAEYSPREHLLAALRDHAVLRAEGQRLIGRNGSHNNWLIDVRKIFMQTSVLDAAADVFWDMCSDKMPFQIGGMEVAAIPLLAAIVMKSKERGYPINGFIVRKERKTYGTGSLIEGTVTDAPIVIIDDILNSGVSLEKVRVVLENENRSIDLVFVLVDFHSTKSEVWRTRHKIPIRAAFKLNDFDLTLSRKEEPPPSTSFHNVWSFSSPDPNYFHRVPKSFPVTDGSHVYFGSDSGYFWCLNAIDGSLAWSFKVDAQGHKNIWSAPAIHDGKVYFGSYDGNVYCLDTQSGAELWRYTGADWVGSSPALAPDLGLLFIGLEFSVEGKRGSIVALNLESGEKVWEHMTKRYTHASPAYWPERQLVACGSNDNEMFLFDAGTGALRWRFETKGEGGDKGSIRHAPAFDIKRGHVITGCADGNIYIIDVETGKEVWSAHTNNTIYTVPLVVDDAAYIGSTDKYLYVLDLERRVVKKKLYAGSKIYGPPRLLAGRIYFGACNGLIYEIDPASVRITGTHQLPDSVTNALCYSAENEQFYALTYVNQLFAFVISHQTNPRQPLKQRRETETTDVAWMLGSESAAGDWELRMSMRSFWKNYLSCMKPWIIGYIPVWIDPQKVTCLPWPDPYQRCKDANLLHKAIRLAMEPRISDPFILCSDDHLLLRPSYPADFGLWHGGAILKELEEGLTSWQRRLVNTGARLRSAGYPAMNFDGHVPYPLRKDWIREALRFDFAAKPGMCVFSTIINCGREPGIPLNSGPIRGWLGKEDITDYEVDVKLTRNQFVCINDDSVNNKHIVSRIEQMFPDPAPWELDAEIWPRRSKNASCLTVA